LYVTDMNHLYIIIFFFSSRRRHTRSDRDWSSDVCSSDLKENQFFHPDLRFRVTFPEGWNTNNGKQAVIAVSPQQDAMVEVSVARSEERRVGKECRSRWAAYH